MAARRAGLGKPARPVCFERSGEGWRGGGGNHHPTEAQLAGIQAAIKELKRSRLGSVLFRERVHSAGNRRQHYTARRRSNESDGDCTGLSCVCVCCNTPRLEDNAPGTLYIFSSDTPRRRPWVPAKRHLTRQLRGTKTLVMEPPGVPPRRYACVWLIGAAEADAKLDQYPSRAES